MHIASVATQINSPLARVTREQSDSVALAFGRAHCPHLYPGCLLFSLDRPTLRLKRRDLHTYSCLKHEHICMVHWEQVLYRLADAAIRRFVSLKPQQRHTGMGVRRGQGARRRARSGDKNPMGRWAQHLALEPGSKSRGPGARGPITRRVPRCVSELGIAPSRLALRGRNAGENASPEAFSSSRQDHTRSCPSHTVESLPCL